MAARRIGRQFEQLGGQAKVRMAGGQPLLTDNGQIILDVSGLDIVDPLAFETLVSQWPGVVTVGVFAYQKAQICLLGTADGVRTVSYEDAGLRT
jgi:ribose 5-phosphate isomerase A